MATNLKNKRALITGASSGLGEHFAETLAQAGAEVIITARRIDRLETLQKKIGEKAHAFAFNVSELNAIDDFFLMLDEKNLRPDILVNNAGMNNEGLATSITQEDYQQIIDTNLSAPFFLARSFARRHIETKTPARVINIASVGAFRVLPGLTPYCVSKAGLVMMTRGLAREWARYNINVNAICPGYIETEINDYWWQTESGQRQIKSYPRRRLAEKSDLDGALLLFAGEEGKGITGTAIQVDDGQYI